MTVIREYTWREMIELTISLAGMVEAAGVRPTIVVPVLRGGSFPALVLSHVLEVRTMYAVRGSITLSDEPRALRRVPIIEGGNSLPDLSRDHVLLVDDVTNTGDTLTAARAAIEMSANPKALSTACVIWDTVAPNGSDRISTCAADFYADRTHAWVSFPWERLDLTADSVRQSFE